MSCPRSTKIKQLVLTEVVARVTKDESGCKRSHLVAKIRFLKHFAINAETLHSLESTQKLLFVANPAQNNKGNPCVLREEEACRINARMTSLNGLLRGCEVFPHENVNISVVLRIMHDYLLLC